MTFARHHRRVVDESIEAVLNELDLGDLERNVVGVELREEVEERLVPGMAAVLALLLEADCRALNESLPEWLDRVSTLLPSESRFLAEMGRCLDLGRYELRAENLWDARPSEVRRAFDVHLWEIAPFVSRGSGAVT